MLRNLERAFESWRRSGDAAALGKVFDRTAPELLRLATHLVRDPADAEDVLQLTYLTAIERADSYECERPLMPWLVGILVNQARSVRRRRRDADLEALGESAGGGEGPPDLVASAEWSQAVVAALCELPEPYREVLRLHLQGGRRPVEIARELGREPGTIRMQVHRGLGLLRRALPAGFATGAVVALTSLQGQALDSLRGRVLEAAASRAVGSSVGAVGSAGAFGKAGSTAGKWGVATVGMLGGGLLGIGFIGTVAGIGHRDLAGAGEFEVPATASIERLDRAGRDSLRVASARVPARVQLPPALGELPNGSLNTEPAPGPAARLLRGRVTGPGLDGMASTRLNVRGTARVAWPEEAVVEATPEADGRFEVDVGELLDVADRLQLSRLLLTVDHPGFMPAEISFESIAEPVEAALEPASFLIGRLRLPPGAEPTAIQVAVLQVLDGRPVAPPVSTAQCDGDGAYTLRLDTLEEHVVVALADGYRPLTLDAYLFAGAIQRLPERGLEAGLSVSGQLFCGGRPVGGARVALAREEGLPLEVLGRALAWSEGAFEIGAGELATRTDGGFHIPGLGPGEHSLRAVALPGGVAIHPAVAAREEFGLSEGLPSESIELGIEVALIDVRVSSTGPGEGLEALRLVAEQAGERVVLPPGPLAVRADAACELRVESNRHASVERRLEPRDLPRSACACEAARVVPIELQRTAVGALALELVHGTGIERPRAVVLELQSDGERLVRRSSVAGGAARVELPLGHHRGALFVGGAGAHYEAYLLPVRLDVDLGSGTATERLVLERGGRLRLRATDATGVPIAADCIVRSAAGEPKRVRFLAFRPERVHNRGGRLWRFGMNDVYPNLAPGDYEVEVSAPGFEARTHWVQVQAGRATELDVILGPGPGGERP